MEQFLNNQQIPLVRVIDPNTGQEYYAPAATVYDDRNGPDPTRLKSVVVDQSISASFAATASFALNGGGTVNTSSLLISASFSDPNLTFEKGDKSTFSVNLSTLTVINAYTASYINGGTF